MPTVTMPAMIPTYPNEKRCASVLAMRSPSPVICTAAPITNPPKTVQFAVEWNPENTTSAGARANSIADRKNSSDVRISGMMAVAQSANVTTISAALEAWLAVRPPGRERTIHRATPAATAPTT